MILASFAAELLKARKRPATWILTAILLFVFVFFGYILSYSSLSHPPAGMGMRADAEPLRAALYPANLIPTVLGFLPPAGAIVTVLGALSAGSEYSWGTVKTILGQRPGRVSVLLGKILTLALTLLLLILVLFAAGALCSFVVARLDGAASHWPPADVLLRAGGAAYLILATWTAFGLVLAVLFQGPALSIGLGLIYTLVLEGFIGTRFGQEGSFGAVRKMLPAANADALIASLDSWRATRVAGPPQALVGPTHAVLVLATYTLVFLILATVVFRQRDIV